MRIAVPADGDNLDAEITDRFGRCRQFLLVDTSSTNFTVLDNRQYAMSDSPGIASAQMLIRHGVSAVIASKCGPNACKLFDAAGITVVTGASGSIRGAVVRFSQENPSLSEDNLEDRDRQR